MNENKVDPTKNYFLGTKKKTFLYLRMELHVYILKVK